MQASELLDRAKSHTGTDRATADALGVASQQLSDWRNRRKPFPLTMQVRVCELAGMTESEQQRYAWEVLRERMGKPHRRSAWRRGLDRLYGRRLCPTCGEPW
jgi:hypothetical protein